MLWVWRVTFDLYLRFFHIALGYLIASMLQGMQFPSRIDRVCLDRFTNTLTVSMTVSDIDACSSFKFHRLYGREDATAPFVLLKEISTLNTSTISLILPNNKRWEVFVSSHFACNGIDSLISNRLFVDDVAPTSFEPDSVSVDYSSQRLIAGWRKPSVNDIKGFSLFKENGGTNLLIKDTFSLTYTFNKGVFNPANFGTIKFSIAAFDSCLNGGILSNYHTPPYLSVQPDPNYFCSRRCTLNLSSYVGWKSDTFWIYRLNTKTNQWKKIAVSAFSSNSAVVIDSNLMLDVPYDYFFRCKKEKSFISSSSNRVLIQLPSISKTNPPTINSVSVSGTSLDLSGISGLLNTGFSSFVEKQNGLGAWQSSNFFNNSGLATTKAINITDAAVNVNTGYYHYRIIRMDQCGDGFDTSEIHTNIWLRESAGTLFWNRYWGWLCASCSKSITYSLNKKDPTTGLWISVGSFQNNQDSFYSAAGKWEGLQRFRVEAINKDNGMVSISNELLVDLGYDNTVKDTFLIPSGFTPEGLNPIFKISNPALSIGESTMDIYNRWGEKVWTGDALKGWDGKDLNGTSLSDGLYVYQVIAVYRNKREVLSGSILMLK